MIDFVIEAMVDALLVVDVEGRVTMANSAAARMVGCSLEQLRGTPISALLEDKLGDLIVQELEVRGRLDGADTNISNVLAALERISRDPPPALMINPDNALDSARSALLISAILPQLRTKAEAVTTDLAKLGEIKAAAVEQQGRLEANLQVLEEEQLRIGSLIAARKQSENLATAALATEEDEAQALADKATSLKQLIEDSAQNTGESVNAWVVEALGKRARTNRSGTKNYNQTFDL